MVRFMTKNELSDQIFLICFFIISNLLLLYGLFRDYHNINTFTTEAFFRLSLSFSASFLGIIFVILEAKEDFSMFFISIIGSSLSLIYLWLFSPLIWDILITIIYIILGFYGIYYWKHPTNQQQNNDHQIITRSLTIKEWILYIFIGILGIYILSSIGIKLGKYTSSIQAISDASTTIISLLGQWFISRKIIEAWYMWILTNIISIPLYISISSYTYAMVYISYLIISFYGYYSWHYNMLKVKNK